MAFFYGVRPLRRSYFPQSLNDSEPRDILALLRGAKNLDEVDSIPEIHTLLREIKASGARVLLLYSPHETQLYRKDFDDIDAIVEKAFAREADLYIGPLATLRAAGDPARIFRDGLHYDVLGTRWWRRFLRNRSSNCWPGPAADRPPCLRHRLKSASPSGWPRCRPSGCGSWPGRNPAARTISGEALLLRETCGCSRRDTGRGTGTGIQKHRLPASVRHLAPGVVLTVAGLGLAAPFAAVAAVGLVTVLARMRPFSWRPRG